MPSVNKVIIVGNLTRDPVTKQLPTQSMVTEFGIAMNRKFKSASGEDREEVAFVDCSAFGRQAETISQFCTKGKPLFVEGRLKYDTWDDKGGAGKRSKLSVVVENFQFLPSNRDAHGDTALSGGTEGSRSTGGSAGDSQSMFTGSAERKGWRGSRNRGEGAADHDRRKVPPEKPFADEKQFAEADIPF